jgi:hypothetical protein
MRVKNPLLSFPRNTPCNFQDEFARAVGRYPSNHTVYKVCRPSGEIIYVGFTDEWMHIGHEIEPRGF